MSSTFMIETPFMSSGLKSPKSPVCVAGGASSNTFTLVFFSCTRRDSVNFWKGRFSTVHLGLIAGGDKNRVTKCRELPGEFVTDAAAAAGDQNRIVREFHN